jgi:hypothetical protein
MWQAILTKLMPRDVADSLDDGDAGRPSFPVPLSYGCRCPIRGLARQTQNVDTLYEVTCDARCDCSYPQKGPKNRGCRPDHHVLKRAHRKNTVSHVAAEMRSRIQS